MAFSRVEALAPATVANVGVGFDILGLAVQGVGDTVIVERRPDPGAVIAEIIGDEGRLPTASDKNTATIAANVVLQTIGASEGVRIWLHKGLPLNSGLGSSAASAVAAAVAVNTLFDSPLTKVELLPACLAGEAAVSGMHADNAGPSLLGGIMLITGTDAEQIIRLPVPGDLNLALVTPAVDVPTAAARAVLPETITLHQMVHQTGAVAQLVDALYRSDIAALGAVIEKDEVVEPARAHLMPYLVEVRAAAKAAGAAGLTISGAGPTLCAVCASEEVANAAAQAMQATYAAHDIASVMRATRIDTDGADILSAE